jgi:hypothetical protein
MHQFYPCNMKGRKLSNCFVTVECHIVVHSWSNMQLVPDGFTDLVKMCQGKLMPKQYFVVPIVNRLCK